MTREGPTYVPFNGEKYPFTEARYGPMSAQRNAWTEAWPNCAVASEPDRFVLTM